MGMLKEDRASAMNSFIIDLAVGRLVGEMLMQQTVR